MRLRNCTLNQIAFIVVLILGAALVWLRSTHGNGTVNYNKKTKEQGSPVKAVRPQNDSYQLNVSLKNSNITKYRIELYDKLQDLVSQRVESRDPDLVSLVREMMDPPSTDELKLDNPIRLEGTPQSDESLKLLNDKENGFFIEAGAFDGETASSTLALEQTKHWNGLLIEVDPMWYDKLRGKNRKCWSINCCLSPYDYPVMMEFNSKVPQRGSLVMSSEKQNADSNKCLCLPLESLLLALNRTHVDFFSLDVEGLELDILKAIPFNRLDITTLSVEYIHGRDGKQAYKDFMESHGYITHKDIRFNHGAIKLWVADFIFAKNITSQ